MPNSDVGYGTQYFTWTSVWIVLSTEWTHSGCNAKYENKEHFPGESILCHIAKCVEFIDSYTVKLAGRGVWKEDVQGSWKVDSKVIWKVLILGKS